MSVPLSEDHLLNEISAEIDDRLKRGEHPTVNEYVERYPSLAEKFEDLIRMAYELRWGALEYPSGPNVNDP